VIPESPRWLAVNRKYEEVTKLLRTICTVNGRKLPDDFDPATLANKVRCSCSLQWYRYWSIKMLRIVLTLYEYLLDR